MIAVILFMVYGINLRKSEHPHPKKTTALHPSSKEISTSLPSEKSQAH